LKHCENLPADRSGGNGSGHGSASTEGERHAGPRTLDLYCGGGGSSWGARMAGAEIVCGVDFWPLATQVYADNFPGAKAVTARLEATTGPGILGDIGPVDLLLASPECTSHTCARGNRARLEESRETALHVLNFVRAFRPRWIVIENVIHMRSWARYKEFISALREHFNLREFVLDAALFGVPQSRKRLFIVGDRVREVPDIAGTSQAGAAATVIDQKNGWRTSPLFSPKRAAPTLARAMRAVDALGEGVPFLIVYYGTDGAGGWQPLDRPLRTLTTLDRFGLVEWESGAPVMRMLQVPELTRAMGFGDEYRLLHGTRRDRIKLLGNAVCPPVVQAIIERLTNGDQPGEVGKPPLRDKGAALPNKRSPP